MKMAALLLLWLAALLAVCYCSAQFWAHGHDTWSQVTYVGGALALLVGPGLIEVGLARLAIRR